MKRKLLLSLSLLSVASLTAFSQAFTPGNLAVYRYGDGSVALPNSLTVPVFIDEYTPAGVLVKTRAIPAVDNGTNFKLTGLGRNSDGTYATEGISTLSQDGKYLTIFGYNQTAGAAVPTTANGLVVGVISADGNYNSTTTLSNDATNGLGSPRSAIIDGTSNIWANGSQNGIHYTTLGATTSTRISTGQASSKSLTIAQTRASGAVQPSRLYVASASASNELPYATPLPTSSTTFTTSANLNSNITANQVTIVTVANRTIIYVADDVANTIRRYYLNYSGAAIGPYASISDVNTTEVKSITAVVRGIEGTKTIVDVYATTWGHNGTGTGTSKLLKFSDKYLTANATDLTEVELATTTTTLLSAPANTLFKSVTLVPTGSTAIGTVVLPINLSYFGGKKLNNGIELSWITQSEKNNSHFNILRSANGDNFQAIGKVLGRGNSDAPVNYSFLDENPAIGTNYYQLSQVDFDAKTSPSKIISVDYGLENTDFNVSGDATNGSVNISVNSLAATDGNIKIYNLSGNEIENISVKIQKDQNVFKIPFNAQKGIYLVSLTTASGRITKKIIF